MNRKTRDKIIRLTRELKDMPVGQNKHITFLVANNRVYSVGFNNYYRTHPMGKKLGYLFDGIHSELDAFIRLKNKGMIPNLSLVNTRINSRNEIGMSKPCEKCTPWIMSLGFKHIYYTDQEGRFVNIY